MEIDWRIGARDWQVVDGLKDLGAAAYFKILGQFHFIFSDSHDLIIYILKYVGI